MKDLLEAVQATVAGYEGEDKVCFLLLDCPMCAFYKQLTHEHINDTCCICPLGNLEDGYCINWVNKYANRKHGWHRDTILKGLRKLEKLVAKIQAEHGSIG